MGYFCIIFPRCHRGLNTFADLISKNDIWYCGLLFKHTWKINVMFFHASLSIIKKRNPLKVSLINEVVIAVQILEVVWKDLSYLISNIWKAELLLTNKEQHNINAWTRSTLRLFRLIVCKTSSVFNLSQFSFSSRNIVIYFYFWFHLNWCVVNYSHLILR